MDIGKRFLIPLLNLLEIIENRFKKGLFMKKFLMILCMLGVLNSYAATTKKAAPEPQYRGFTVQSMDRALLEEAVTKWNANQVRYMICPFWQMNAMKMPSQKATWDKLMADLPAGLDVAKELGLAVALDLHQLPIDNPKTYSADGKESSHLWWEDENNLKVMIDCWKQIAEICKDRDQVIWLDLWNEPLDWTVVHSEHNFPVNWPKWAQKTINAIRKIDKRHPIAIEPGPGMLSWGFKGFPLLKDPYQKLIYSVHVYQPVEYTHQGVQHENIMPWPGVFGDNGGGGWSKDRLLQEYSAAIEYQKKYGVRIWVGEFSAPRWAPGSAEYLRDCIDIFEELGWDWNYHALKEAQVWDLDAGEEIDLYDTEGKYVRTGITDPKSGLKYPKYGTPDKKPVPMPKTMTERGRVIKKYLDRNKKIVRKVMILGNSITRHDPSKELGWPHNNGMAATSPEKDFAHLVYKRICDVQPEFKPELKLVRITDEAHMTGFESLVPCDADLIIVELGDNFRSEVSIEGIQKPYEAMLVALKKNNNGARVFCVSTWGGAKIDPFIKQAAKNQGATFVDISMLYADPKNRAESEGHFTNWGVNWHPGDRGMKAIADTIWNAIK
jgi:hypothetical protein